MGGGALACGVDIICEDVTSAPADPRDAPAGPTGFCFENAPAPILQLSIL